MINIKNTNNIVLLEEDETDNGVIIVRLVSPINLAGKEVKEIKSGVYISCSENYERVFFFGELNANKDYFVSVESTKIGKESGEVEIILNLANFISEPSNLEKGVEIGRIYKTYIDGIIDIVHSTGLNIYNDDKISCKSVDNKIRNFEISVSPDGIQTLKIDLI